MPPRATRQTRQSQRMPLEQSKCWQANQNSCFRQVFINKQNFFSACTLSICYLTNLTISCSVSHAHNYHIQYLFFLMPFDTLQSFLFITSPACSQTAFDDKTLLGKTATFRIFPTVQPFQRRPSILAGIRIRMRPAERLNASATISQELLSELIVVR